MNTVNHIFGVLVSLCLGVTGSCRDRILLIGILYSTCVYALDVSHVPESEWEQLFNGKDLNGWLFKFDREEVGINSHNTVSVRDGMIYVLHTRPFSEVGVGVFSPPVMYSHYICRVEYKFDDPNPPEGFAAYTMGNNGVLVQVPPGEESPLDDHRPNCFEAQLHTGRTGDLFFGWRGGYTTPTLFGRKNNDRHYESIPHAVHDRDWNNFAVLVLGDSVVYHILEGDTILKHENMSHGEGYIALQAEGQTTWFRKFELLNLKGCMDRTSPSYRDYFMAHDPEACDPPVEGCMDTAYLEYDPAAMVQPEGACSTLDIYFRQNSVAKDIGHDYNGTGNTEFYNVRGIIRRTSYTAGFWEESGSENEPSGIYFGMTGPGQLELKSLPDK
jgi:hypothetical protein